MKNRWATPTRLVVMSFAAVIVVGTIALMIPVSTSTGTAPALIDALFTATSAVCVTGLIVVNTSSYWSSIGQAIILLLIQIGGLGLMTFSTVYALMVGRNLVLGKVNTYCVGPQRRRESDEPTF
jgi:trk system potassium uptake protein TrkH